MAATSPSAPALKDTDSLLRDLPLTDILPLVERLCDVALLLGADGVIREVGVFSDELPGDLPERWRGVALTDMVVDADRARVHEVLAADDGDSGPRRLDVSHPLPDDQPEMTVQYQLSTVGDGQCLLALGRDMRPVVNLRTQLVNAQQALEQDYWRLRQLETRYRRLFDMVGDGVLILDALSCRVLEANPRANDLLAGGERALIGKTFPRGFSRDAELAIQELLREVRATGRGQLSGLALADDSLRTDLVVSYLRQGGEERFLVRVGARQAPAGTTAPAALFLQEALRRAPDAVILLDGDGRVLAVNRSFLEMAQLLGDDQAVGQLADRWLGRSSVDLNVLLSNLREHEAVRLFASTLLPEGGSPLDVEVSACRLEEPDGPAYALFVRDIGRRVARDHPVAAQLPRSIEQVTQRVGRVPLKELVRESTDIIEALCIETALEVTRDNRASAAELLGLSRQSLYAKLRRFNIGSDADGE